MTNISVCHSFCDLWRSDVSHILLSFYHPLIAFTFLFELHRLCISVSVGCDPLAINITFLLLSR